MKEKEATITVSLKKWNDAMEALEKYKMLVVDLEFEVTVLRQEIANLRNQELARLDRQAMYQSHSRKG